MRPTQGPSRTSIVLAGAAASVLACAIPAAGGVGGGGSVRVSSTGDNAELVKTIPIGRSVDDKPKVVMSLGSSKVGQLEDGDRIEGTAEVEVTVCLKKNPLHPGPGNPCVGKTYGYNPRVQAQLVLGPTASSAGGGSTVAVSDPLRKKCTQRQPNRNHHCVLVIDDGRLDVEDADALPCSPGGCNLNLVVSAWDRDARKGHKLAIGSVDAKGHVVGDQGAVNVIRFRPGDQPKQDPIVGERERSRLPINGDDQEPRKKVVYSARLSNLKAGEQIAVEGAAVAKINHLAYSVFMTTEVVLSESPGSVKNNAPVNLTSTHGRVSKGNGFNCTQGRSGHKTPCVAKKVGVLEIVQNRNAPVYVNLVSGMRTQFPPEKHRKGDKAKLTDKGSLNVYRYGP
jgi:hypothetical protein